jgi:TPR repeat protein
MWMKVAMPEYRPSFAIDRQYADCPGCGRDLSDLDRAIFCPGCGRQLQYRITIRERLANAACGVLSTITFGRFGHGPHIPITQINPDRTPILIGYSNAMFKLGWRYERGQGTFRNLPEALRCYRKSARLGNPDATVRLAVGDAAKPVRVKEIEP